MDKQRLEFAFRKVCHDHRVRILLQFAVLHSAPIEHVRQMIQNWMNDEWASVFNQEHGLPTDLRSQVLHHQFASVTNTGGGQDDIVVKCLGFALERELLPFDIELLKRVPYVRRKTR